MTNTLKRCRIIIRSSSSKKLIKENKMLSELGNSILIISAFGLAVCFIFILKSELPKPKYENYFHGGKPFSEEMFKRFEKMRKENNPDNEPVGINNHRCPKCGSKKIDKKFKSTEPFNHEIKLIKNCGYCQLVIASM